MAVAFDSKATSVTANTANTGTVTNTTLTIGASGTLVIAAFAGSDNTTAPVPTAMTWNSVAMTLIGSKAQASGVGNIYVYGLVNPTTGNHTCSCTYTAGTGSNDGIYFDCWSFSGTDTSSLANAVPAASVQTDASTPTGTVYPTAAFSVTTVNGDAISSAMSCDINQFPTTTGTLIHTANTVNGNYTSGYKLATTTTTTIQFTGGASGSPACGVVFRIQQPQSSVTTVILPPAPHPLPRKGLPLGDYPFLAFTDLAKEDIARFGWHQWLSEPTRPRPPPFLVAEQYSFEFLTPIILPGTGQLLWYQPLSGVMIINTIGSD